MTTKPICKDEHAFILQGNCPWCGCFIRNGEVDADAPAADTATLQWNTAALSKALEDESEEVRLSAVTGFFSHPPSADVAIPLLAKAIADRSDRIRQFAENALHNLGRDLDVEAGLRLAATLTGSPHELATRILLAAHYSFEQTGRRENILWLIEHAPLSHTAGGPFVVLPRVDDPDYVKARSNWINEWLDQHAPAARSADRRPESPRRQRDNECYLQAKQLWLAHLEADPYNTALLGNAAYFFLLNNPPLVEELLTRAAAVDPSNPEWRERLGQLYSLRNRIHRPAAEFNDAKRALRELQAAEEIRHGLPWHGETQDDDSKSEEEIFKSLIERTHSLPQLAEAAFIAGEFDLARRYASSALAAARSTELPEFFREDGYPIFHGNIILGRCALRDGNVELAKQFLLAAGNCKGAPTLNSFGPNMSLARELLERGERDVVLEFFELCRKFWECHKGRLDEWSDAVRGGLTPNFSANLDN